MLFQYKTHESQRGNRIFDEGNSQFTWWQPGQYRNKWRLPGLCESMDKLKHVFDDTFRFLNALEMNVYELLLKQTPRERMQLMK